MTAFVVDFRLSYGTVLTLSLRRGPWHRGVCAMKLNEELLYPPER